MFPSSYLVIKNKETSTKKSNKTTVQKRNGVVAQQNKPGDVVARGWASFMRLRQCSVTMNEIRPSKWLSAPSGKAHLVHMVRRDIIPSSG